MGVSISELEGKYILFGAKRNKINKYLMDLNSNVLCIFDNYISEGGGEIPICKPELIPEVEARFVVVATWANWEEIRKQLKELGYVEDRILIALEDVTEFGSFEWISITQGINIRNPEPKILNLELSGYCNCKCVYCPFHGEMNLKKERKGLMSLETAHRIADMASNIRTIDTIDATGPGEIFINKQWYEILTILLQKIPTKRLYLYTNGILLNESNIRRIGELPSESIVVEVSIDGESPYENDRYRVGSHYETIKNNIRSAAESWRNKSIELVITNCHAIEEKELVENNYIVDSKISDIPKFLANDFPDICKVSQKTFCYGNKNVKYKDFKRVEVSWPDNSKRCLNLFHRLAVDYEGNLLKCSCGAAGVQPIAGIGENYLELWKNNEEIVRARKNFIRGVNEEDFCSYCPGKGMGQYYVLVRKK